MLGVLAFLEKSLCVIITLREIMYLDMYESLFHSEACHLYLFHRAARVCTRVFSTGADKRRVCKGLAC